MDHEISICILSLDAFPLFAPSYLNETSMGRVGGAELQIYYFARELARDDRFRVHVIVDDYGQDQHEYHEGVHLHRCSFRRKVNSIQPFSRRARLTTLFHRISADVYVHRAISLQTTLLALYCKFTGHSFLYMMNHDGGAIPELDPNRSSSGWFLKRSAFEFGLRTADQILVQNGTQQRALHKNYGRSSRIRPSAHPIEETGTLNEERKYITWIARSDRWKQPERFLELARSFPEESFLMIMPNSGDTSYWQRVKTDARKVENLKFLDFVPHHQIRKCFQTTRIFVNTSSSEGFPNTFIQAASTFTPILSYAVDPDGILQKYNMGICAGGDPSKLEDELRYLINNEERVKQMGKNAREYAKKNHDLDKIIEEDKKIIISLVQS